MFVNEIQSINTEVFFNTMNAKLQQLKRINNAFVKQGNFI